VKEALFTSWSQTSGEATQASLQGAANAMVVVNDSHAYIDEGAKVNQNPLYRSTAQDVIVKAVSDVTTWNIAGVIPPGNAVNFLVLTGTRASAVGGGMTLLGNVYVNNVTAEIKGDRPPLLFDPAVAVNTDEDEITFRR